jgi:hypothetical protein
MNPYGNAMRQMDFPETSLGGYLPVVRNHQRNPEDSRASAPTTPAAFAAALDRLEEALDEETGALRSRQPVDLDELNRRKSRSLLELTRLSRGLAAPPDGALGARLRALAGKLAENRDVLALHLGAVREIADLLVNALGEAESDGTYAVPGMRQGAAAR